MTHLGYKTTLTFSGQVLYEKNMHATTETANTSSAIKEHPDTPPPVYTHALSVLYVSELLAGYYRGQANPAPVFSAVKQLEAHKLLTS